MPKQMSGSDPLKRHGTDSRTVIPITTQQAALRSLPLLRTFVRKASCCPVPYRLKTLNCPCSRPTINGRRQSLNASGTHAVRHRSRTGGRTAAVAKALPREGLHRQFRTEQCFRHDELDRSNRTSPTGHHLGSHRKGPQTIRSPDRKAEFEISGRSECPDGFDLKNPRNAPPRWRSRFGDRNPRHAARTACKTYGRITCGIPSRNRKWRSRPAHPRCGAAGCTWPYGPNATWNRS